MNLRRKAFIPGGRRATRRSCSPTLGPDGAPTTSSTTPNSAPARSLAAPAAPTAQRDEDGVDDEHGDLKCQWAGCHARFADAELLFHHLSEDHVGRKAAGTLCLECKWTLPGGHICGLAKTKRDHLTSHLRVHMTDLKPHWCPDCKKRFKRPQDLKKHELTFSHIATRTKNSRRRSAQLAPTTPNEAPGAASSSSAPVASRSLGATSASASALPSPPPPPPRRASSSGSSEGSLLAPPNAHRLQLPTPALSGRDGPSPSPVGLPPVNYARMPSPMSFPVTPTMDPLHESHATSWHGHASPTPAAAPRGLGALLGDASILADASSSGTAAAGTTNTISSTKRPRDDLDDFLDGIKRQRLAPVYTPDVMFALDAVSATVLDPAFELPTLDAHDLHAISAFLVHLEPTMTLPPLPPPPPLVAPEIVTSTDPDFSDLLVVESAGVPSAAMRDPALDPFLPAPTRGMSPADDLLPPSTGSSQYPAWQHYAEVAPPTRASAIATRSQPPPPRVQSPVHEPTVLFNLAPSAEPEETDEEAEIRAYQAAAEARGGGRFAGMRCLRDPSTGADVPFMRRGRRGYTPPGEVQDGGIETITAGVAGMGVADAPVQLVQSAQQVPVQMPVQQQQQPVQQQPQVPVVPTPARNHMHLEVVQVLRCLLESAAAA
ncbi:hypothetical protein AMAG_03578 [Allomyces macrogynus ATCC 38327]|uniref:C2H2-type domain-containing protein n=1 Tax=Allomyces macrogynus (strain ATCC 38327) TaxID=578462 RepID=A0A0L0SA00_ALLM3|nr:hypothetical protein AMAG_03578 [Allomyces macrogynus ATCC 38327]|eukprot:KNE59267.1 hypothetical protein AMAG_03578 [Allomyces macrogynus ATCC 38327]